MELLQLFDEKHHIIDEKVDRSVKKTIGDGKKYMVVLLFIENDKGEFLIQKTSKEKKSIFAVTGGHVIYKDDSLKTVKKETKEELGITLKDEDLTFIDYTALDNCYCDIYYTKKNYNLNDLVLQKDEVDSVYWYSLDKINKLKNEGLFRKKNMLAFDIVLKSLKK